MAKVTEKQLAEAIRVKGGVITSVAKELGISFQAVYKRINNSKKLQEVLEEARESLLDMAESALFRQIQSGNMTAICFFLKTQGKHRGYVERQESEVSGPGGRPLSIRIVGVDPERKDGQSSD
jgi:predicted transcriptional regulator